MTERPGRCPRAVRPGEATLAPGTQAHPSPLNSGRLFYSRARSWRFPGRQPLTRSAPVIATIATYIWTRARPGVQTYPANPSSEGSALAIFNWTGQRRSATAYIQASGNGQGVEAVGERRVARGGPAGASRSGPTPGWLRPCSTSRNRPLERSSGSPLQVSSRTTAKSARRSPRPEAGSRSSLPRRLPQLR